MTSAHVTPLLEWALLSTSLVAVTGAVLAWIVAYGCRDALRLRGENGALARQVEQHIRRANVRLLCGLVSGCAAVTLLILRDAHTIHPAGMVARCVWLFHNIGLVTQLVIDYGQDTIGARRRLPLSRLY
jgi:hypothetical protein